MIKKKNERTVCAKAVKMPVEMLASHIEVSGFESQFHFWHQLPANVDPGTGGGGTNITAEVDESLLPTWETKMEVQVPGCKLTQRYCEHLGSEPVDGRYLYLYAFVSLLIKEIKQIFKECTVAILAPA